MSGYRRHIKSSLSLHSSCASSVAVRHTIMNPSSIVNSAPEVFELIIVQKLFHCYIEEKNQTVQFKSEQQICLIVVLFACKINSDLMLIFRLRKRIYVYDMR